MAGKGYTMTKASTHKFKWKIFAAGMVSIVAGYFFLAAADITFAPILLVLGYCILIPLSFL
jgi:hypothetical protein